MNLSTTENLIQPSNLANTRGLTPSRRAITLTYGISCYLLGVAGLLAIIAFAAGFYPLANSWVISANPVVAVLLNILLTLLFGLQHSVMARPGFKKIFHNLFGTATERSTYVAASGIVSIIVVTLWQPLAGMVWQTGNPWMQFGLWGLFLFGWSYLLAATFAINHWDLFGLRQVWLAAHNKAYSAPTFNENWMYRYSRHPIMLGCLIGLWCVPSMPATQFVFAATLSAYIFIGVAFEERDLVAQFGERYLEYKRRVGMFLSLPIRTK